MVQESMDVREHIKKEPLIFDGGMGTYYAQKTHTRGKGVELANIETPRVVEEIHTEYLRAGAQAIKANTFAANRIVYQGDTALVERILCAGWEIAARAAEPFGGYVFADIGPVTGLPPASSIPFSRRGHVTSSLRQTLRLRDWLKRRRISSRYVPRRSF